MYIAGNPWEVYLYFPTCVIIFVGSAIMKNSIQFVVLGDLST